MKNAIPLNNPENNICGDHIMDIIHTFTTAMGKYLTGILICFALLFSLSGMQSEKNVAGVQTETSVSCLDVGSVGESSSGCVATENGGAIHDPFYLKICEIPISVVLSPRGGGFFRNLKFLSMIHILSDSTTSLFEKSSLEQYLHSGFVKTSYRYFVYTLRRLLI